MLCPLSLSLFALLALPQDPPDPERSPAGRERFLGREIAQTMHWTGAPWLLRATREDEENGAALRRWLAVPAGAAVADLGCGNGYHTLPLAAAVGATGKVFAVELQPEMLVLLQKRAAGKQLENVVLVESTVDDPKLPKQSCDLVLLVDVYHELSHPVTVMGHVREALRPGGRVVLVEFRAEDPEVPIKPEHKMTKAQVVREMAAHGFALADAFDGLPWQHAMAFAPAATGARLAPREVLRSFLAAVGAGDVLGTAPFLGGGLTVAALPALPADARFELRVGPDGRLLAELRTARGERLAHDRDEVVLGCDRDGCWRIEAVRARQPFRRAHGAMVPFVAMQTATGGGEPDAQVQLVQELGFDGLAWDLDRLAAVREAVEARGGDLVSAYAVLDLGAGVPLAERLAPVRRALQELAGGPGMLWLALQQSGRAPRDPDGDPAVVAALQALLAAADATGVEIALYPHHGFWLEAVDDALRLCGKVEHPRLGICFNLCHFLRAGEGPDPAPLLQRCGARLFAATVHGADVDGRDWGTLIRPLDEGSFEVESLLRALAAVPFDGPVGLQGFGLRLPARDHLQRSMAAWRALHAPAPARK